MVAGDTCISNLFGLWVWPENTEYKADVSFTEKFWVFPGIVIESFGAVVLCLLKAPTDEVGGSGHCHLNLLHHVQGCVQELAWQSMPALQKFIVALWLDPAHTAGLLVKHWRAGTHPVLLIQTVRGGERASAVSQHQTKLFIMAKLSGIHITNSPTFGSCLMFSYNTHSPVNQKLVFLSIS